MPTLDDDSGSDREDELPQVVVVQSGDLTAEEAKKIKQEQHPGQGEGISSSRFFLVWTTAVHLWCPTPQLDLTLQGNMKSPLQLVL